MCWCRPEIRTPCCGRLECHPPLSLNDATSQALVTSLEVMEKTKKPDMTAEEYEQKTGFPPQNDDLDRVNCKTVGEVGHWQCGWCKTHDLPRFSCPCKTAASYYGIEIKGEKK